MQTEHPDAGRLPPAWLVQDGDARTLGASLGAQLPRARLPRGPQALTTAVPGRARATGGGARAESVPQQYPGRGLPASREHGHRAPGVRRAPRGRTVQSAHQVRARRR